jgi:nicotinate-nucleotide adenylyltransferase
MTKRTAVAPLGILGGTFDPVHFGHLRLAEEAAEALALAEVLWIPAGHPRHREPPRTAPAHRLAMVRLAVADRPGFAVDATEADYPGASYTVPTLERLRREQGPSRPLVLLLGTDAFAGLASWHRWRELFDLAHVAVATRPGYGLEGVAPDLADELRARRVETPAELAARPHGSILTFVITPLAIAATDIRERLAAGRSARYLLPDAVLDYLGRNHLYSD